MKVIHYSWTANIGGIERFVIDLVESQRKQGIDSQILVGKEIGDFEEEIREKTIPVTCLNLASGLDYSSTKIIRAIKLFKQFEVIHIHSFHPLIALAAIRAKTKIVYTLHGLPPQYSPHNLRRSVIEKLKKFFLNQAINYLTFNSEFTKRNAEVLYSLRGVPKGVVPNGICIKAKQNENLLSGELIKRIKNKFIVGTTTRFTPRKRLDRLVKGFADFASSNNVILLMVGEGTERLSFEKTVSSLGIKDKVIFAGYQVDVRSYQNIIDIAVYPSAAEPFGLVAIEFYLLGKPVLVFNDGGGLVEIVSRINKNDIVNSTKELSERLALYYQDRQMLESQKDRLKKYAQTFDIKYMTDKFTDIYSNVLA